ncbi:hypothetical protein MRX96_002864 [Rhipicephalus microplus]
MDDGKGGESHKRQQEHLCSSASPPPPPDLFSLARRLSIIIIARPRMLLQPAVRGGHKRYTQRNGVAAAAFELLRKRSRGGWTPQGGGARAERVPPTADAGRPGNKAAKCKAKHALQKHGSGKRQQAGW